MVELMRREGRSPGGLRERQAAVPGGAGREGAPKARAEVGEVWVPAGQGDLRSSAVSTAGAAGGDSTGGDRMGSQHRDGQNAGAEHAARQLPNHISAGRPASRQPGAGPSAASRAPRHVGTSQGRREHRPHGRPAGTRAVGAMGTHPYFFTLAS